MWRMPENRVRHKVRIEAFLRCHPKEEGSKNPRGYGNKSGSLSTPALVQVKKTYSDYFADFFEPFFFSSPDVAANGVSKSGYIMNASADVSATTVTPAAMNCNASAQDAMSSYFAEAHPQSIGVSGQRSFATDARGSLYFTSDGSIVAPGMAGASVLR